MGKSFDPEEEEGETGRPPGGFPRRLSLHAQAFVPGADGHHLGELPSSLPGWQPEARGEYYAKEHSDNEDDDTDDLEITIYSALGKQVLQKRISSGFEKINLQEHAKGVYFVELKSGNKIKQRKLLLQ